MTALKDLRPYPAYRPSGVEGLGDVPEHWEVRRLKCWVRMNDAELPETTSPEFAFRYLEIGAVGTGFLKEEPTPMRFAHAPSRARRIVRSGDTIVSTVRTYLKAVWFAEDVEDALICSTGFVVLTPGPGTAPKFVSYSVQSNGFIDRLTAGSVGIAYPAVAESRFGSLHVCVPPLSEQIIIVCYLDYIDRRIRRYIQAKERLITLLKEKRQAAVSQAVTRGLDPSVSLKPSGVEWLGNVPAHWERQRLKSLLRPVDRRSVAGNEALLSLRRDYGVVAYNEHFTRPPQSRSLIGFKQVEPGQLVVNRLQANNGLIFCSRLNGLVSPDYSVFEARRPLRMQFVSDLFRTQFYRVHFRREATGLGTGAAGFLRLYDDRFLQTPVFLPPLYEQTAIIGYLDRATADIDTTIASVRRQIELLKEYRSRLVADLVMGKLDARDVETKLLEFR